MMLSSNSRRERKPAAHDKGGLTDDEVAAEAQTYIIAGTDPTATTLTYLVWAMSKQPEYERRLMEGIRKAGIQAQIAT